MKSKAQSSLLLSDVYVYIYIYNKINIFSNIFQSNSVEFSINQKKNLKKKYHSFPKNIRQHNWFEQW